MCKSLMGCLATLFMLAVFPARGQVRVTGPGDELLVFENVKFGPGATDGATRTQVSGTVTNITSDYLSNVLMKVQFFDNTSRLYPRPSISCKFTIEDLVPSHTRELGEKNLKEIVEHHATHGVLTLGHRPTDCNVVLRSLKVTSFSLEIMSALHGKYALTTVKPYSRLYRKTEGYFPWDVLSDQTEVAVLEFVPGRDSPYKVMILDDGRIGFVQADKIVVTAEVDALRKAASDSAGAAPQPPNEEEDRLKGKYGPDIASRILAGKFWIGMTREMALESLGKPDEIDRALLIESAHEEWVYGSSLYLYFDNGILTSYRKYR